MKWLLYLAAGVVGVVVLAVIVLLLIGGGRGESRLSAAIDIAQPTPVVYQWISEPQRLTSWVGWLIEVRALSPDATSVGSKQLWVMEDRNNNNQRMDIHSEVVRMEPGRLLTTAVSAQEGFTGEITYELQALEPSRTRLLYRSHYQFDHWLAKLLGPIITRSAQQKLEEDLARLKQQAESASDVALGK